MIYKFKKGRKFLSRSIYFSTINTIVFLGLYIGTEASPAVGGKGPLKLAVSALMLISFYYLLMLFFRNFKKTVRSGFSRYYIFCFSLLIIYGLITSFRSFTLDKNILSLFGNPFYALAWFAPIAFILGSDPDNLVTLNKASIFLIKIGIFVAPLLLLINTAISGYGFYFFSCLYFLPFLTWKYQEKADKIWIVIGIVLFLIYSFLFSVRIGFIQVLLHLMAFSTLAILDFLKKGPIGKLKAFLLAMAGVILFALVIYYSDDITSHISADNKQDTRSFLYIEVFGDLASNHEFTFGKGALGKYWSDFFDQWQSSGEEGGDVADRMTVEVGFLEMLLKGGWVMVVLFFMICIPATFQAIFRSDNLIAKGLGFYCLIYMVILFISNRPLYSNVYIYFWIIIGFCASKSFRNLKEKNICI